MGAFSSYCLIKLTMINTYIFRSCSSKTMSKFLNYMLSRACILSILLTLAQHAGVTLADPDKTCDYLSTPRVGGICGHHLANLLSMICESLQNSHAFTRYIVKRQTEKCKYNYNCVSTVSMFLLSHILFKTCLSYLLRCCQNWRIKLALYDHLCVCHKCLNPWPWQRSWVEPVSWWNHQ